MRYLAGEAGIRQFLDIGTGLPTANNTHQIAQQVAPESRIVYVDNDPMVLVHAQALLTSAPGGMTSYIEADVRDPDAILREAAETLDLSQPVALMMLGILGQIDDSDEPGSILTRLLAALPSGSTVPRRRHRHRPRDEPGHRGLQPELGQFLPPAYPEQIAAFFGGLDLVPPGVLSTSRWRPDIRDAEKETREVGATPASPANPESPPWGDLPPPRFDGCGNDLFLVR